MTTLLVKPTLTKHMRSHYTMAQLTAYYAGIIGRDRLYRLVHAGHIKGSTVNRKLVIAASEVARFDQLIHSPQPVTLKDTDGSVLLETLPCN